MPPKAWEEIKSFMKNLIGNTADTGGSDVAGSVFAKQNKIISDIAAVLTKQGSTAQVTAQTKKFTEIISGQVDITTTTPFVVKGSGRIVLFRRNNYTFEVSIDGHVMEGGQALSLDLPNEYFFENEVKITTTNVARVNYILQT